MDGLKQDLSILKDMYPEVELFFDVDALIDEDEILQGKLNFTMIPSNDITVELVDHHSLQLSKLPGNTLYFNIRPQFYPSHVNINLESIWLNNSDKKLLLDAIHEEFHKLTDPTSELYDPETPILMLIFSFLIDDSAQIVFPNNVRKCQDEVEYQTFTHVLQLTNRDNFNMTNFECCICIEVKKGSEMIKLPNCSHYLCKKCIKEYFTTMILEGRISNVRCPECPHREIKLETYQKFASLKKDIFQPQIPFEFFHGILDDDICTRYEELFWSQNCVKLSKYSPFACTNCPHCNKWCVKNNLDEPLITCTNTECQFTFCFDCLHSWHGYNNICGKKVTIDPVLLEEYINAGEGDDRVKEIETKYGKRVLKLAVSEYIAERDLEIALNTPGSDLQRCPNCSVVVQRSEGCNRMKCGICGTLFCYLCGVSLFVDDCYKHFRDPRLDCFGKLFEGMPGTEGL